MFLVQVLCDINILDVDCAHLSKLSSVYRDRGFVQNVFNQQVDLEFSLSVDSLNVWMSKRN